MFLLKDEDPLRRSIWFDYMRVFAGSALVRKTLTSQPFTIQYFRNALTIVEPRQTPDLVDILTQLFGISSFAESYLDSNTLAKVIKLIDTAYK